MACCISFISVLFVMIRRQPRSTRTDTLFPYTTLFRAILVHADQLAVDGGQRKGHERPAAPAHPFRDGTALAVFAGPFGQHALGAQPAAPRADRKSTRLNSRH